MFAYYDGLNYPNGVVVDRQNNRLLVSAQAEVGRPINAIGLADSSVTTVVNTQLDGVDGLAMDRQNRLYLSSWGSHGIHMYDVLFANPPELVSGGHNEPADIYINLRDNILCVPNFYDKYR